MSSSFDYLRGITLGPILEDTDPAGEVVQEGEITSADVDVDVTLPGGTTIDSDAPKEEETTEEPVVQADVSVEIKTPGSYIDTNKTIDLGEDESAVVATESFNLFPTDFIGKKQVAMAGVTEQQVNPSKPIVILRNGKNTTVVFNTNSQCLFYDDGIVLQLVVLLQMAEPDETITFILGSDLSPKNILYVGPILAAMRQSEAKIVTKCYGPCSISEVMIWMHGTEKVVGRYGMMSFGGYKITEFRPVIRPFFDMLLTDAKSMGLLTSEDIDSIVLKGKDKDIISSELIALLGNRTDPAEVVGAVTNEEPASVKNDPLDGELPSADDEQENVEPEPSSDDQASDYGVM